MSRTAQQVLDGAAEVVARWPGVWSRLLATHTAGSDGRCRGCPSAVRVAPRWPCPVATVASTAHTLHNRS